MAIKFLFLNIFSDVNVRIYSGKRFQLSHTLLKKANFQTSKLKLTLMSGLCYSAVPKYYVFSWCRVHIICLSVAQLVFLWLITKQHWTLNMYNILWVSRCVYAVLYNVVFRLIMMEDFCVQMNINIIAVFVMSFMYAVLNCMSFVSRWKCYSGEDGSW